MVLFYVWFLGEVTFDELKVSSLVPAVRILLAEFRRNEVLAGWCLGLLSGPSMWSPDLSNREPTFVKYPPHFIFHLLVKTRD